MAAPNQTIQMPEFLVFLRIFILGFVSAELLQITFYLSSSFALMVLDLTMWITLPIVLAILVVCLTYAINRDFMGDAKRLISSNRLDLLIFVALGIGLNVLGRAFLDSIHLIIKQAPPELTLCLLGVLLTPMVSALIIHYRPRKNAPPAQFGFLSDEEYKPDDEDLLEHKKPAKLFAEFVLASETNSKLVFGIDGPWGSGKTSFVNIAEAHWKKESDVIVCRFEPLRYASEPEPDLSQRLMREITEAIQKHLFIPEFRSAASRYSRLIKGDPYISLFGLRFSFAPRDETVDELLENINAVLERIRCRLIIVIDDLDRLDPKAVNNVLFVTRRVISLSRTTYILCYDTEILVKGKEDGDKAREFLEKFVTIKQSLFVENNQIIKFLSRDWQQGSIGAIPADTMLKISPVLTELAEILCGDEAGEYMKLAGDLRKIKRFVNTLLLLQVEKTDFAMTDFNRRDLINLILIHLHYPGLFRHIYTEETNGRSGTYSISRKFGDRNYKNSEKFSELLKDQKGSAEFLLRKLFDESTLKRRNGETFDESELRSRACFNEEPHRILEQYLLLIVKFIEPEPRTTYALYNSAVQSVLSGEKSINSTLKSEKFLLRQGTHPHNEFWRLLVNESHSFNDAIAEEAINTIIEYIPKYALISTHNLREKSIYYLLLLLDRAGWGRTFENRRNNTPEIIVEIARRFYGEREHENKGLIKRIAAGDRGALGWYDLMSLRLPCSADRGGQLFNINRALIVNENPETPTEGSTRELAKQGMRRISQEVFKHFKNIYIDTRRNFFADMHDIPDDDFLGDNELITFIKQNQEQQKTPLEEHVAATRSRILLFVIYQLSNPYPPSGSGVGCGFYDEQGTADEGRIAGLMNTYIFEFCFNPSIERNNVFYFLDYCLTKLRDPFFSDNNEAGYFATKEELSNGLDAEVMGKYWLQHRDTIRSFFETYGDRVVITSNYKVSYREYLPKVFQALDELGNITNAG